MNGKRIFSLNTMRVCIDAHSHSVSGKVYSKLSPTPIVFSGLGEMILRMDQLFDRCGYPQAFQERRSFRTQEGRARPWRMPESRLSDAEMDRKRGKEYTFDVVVQSRRQTGWQGLLMQTDRKLLARFNSEMELLDSICRELKRQATEKEPLTG